MTWEPARTGDLEDRVEMLETVVRLLLTHMSKDHVISEKLPRELVDSLIDISTGNDGQSLQAERWKSFLEGSGDEEDAS